MFEYGGWKSAWDERAWTWETSYTQTNCPPKKIATTSAPGPGDGDGDKAPYVPPPEPTFAYDPCMDPLSEERIDTERLCQAARDEDDIGACCANIGGDYCNNLMTDCPLDTCLNAQGDANAFSDQIGELLIDPILRECDDLVVDEENYVVFVSMSPTSKPTLEPTPSPTEMTFTPTFGPTDASNAPTSNPTEDSNAPTMNPSDPSSAPTFKPTRFKLLTNNPTERPSSKQMTEDPTVATYTTTAIPTERPIYTVDPTKLQTPRPTKDDGRDNDNGNGWGSPKPSRQSKSPRPTPARPTKAPKSPRPTKGEKTSRPTTIRTPRPTPQKIVKTPRPTPDKTPRPTKPQKMPRPTKGEKTKAPKTVRPTMLRTARPIKNPPTKHPTVGAWGEPKPSSMENAGVEMVDINSDQIINDFKPATIGYQVYVEVIGVLSVGIVLIICSYSLCCRCWNSKYNDQYQPIKDPRNTSV